ncbi:MAG: hypothetical protein SCH70_07870, partial [Candidatus Methanoperedens sp.]|nr:hypothetical protein [Candidatus Methanoperedens sp.]
KEVENENYCGVFEMRDFGRLFSEVLNMVFGNSFTILEESKDFDFLEQLNPKSLSINKKAGRHAGWKFYDDDTELVIPRDKILHIPTNQLAGSTWGVSSLQPLTRIIELKEEIETNLMFLVKRYLVPRYVYLLGKEGTSVPQEVIDEFAKSLANPDVAQDQVFENNIKIETLGTQYKALHVGYILDYVIKSLHTGLAFPDSFYIAKGSTESTAKVQTEIFNKKRIGGLQRVYTGPMKQIMGAILDREGIKYDKLPEPKWGQLSGMSLEAKVEYILRLAGITDSEGNRALQIPELRTFMAKELGIELEP